MTQSNPWPVVVVALFLAGGIAGIAHPAGAATDSVANTGSQPSDHYVVEQGDLCQPIEPISTETTVESFYEYRTHETHPDLPAAAQQYSSYGTTHLQEDDTSLLFLHEGTDGMSLVVIHDRLDGETAGGVVTFEIVGSPPDAEWAVQDDLYEGESNMDEWETGDGWAGASWIWRDARSDGGALRGGLNDEFALTIQPAFNEDAAFYDDEDLYDPEFFDDGEIDDWAVLSGDSEDPERTTLPTLDEPVTIRTGTCDDPTVTYNRTDDGIRATIDGATIDDRVALQPTAGTNDEVTFESVALAGVDDTASVTFESREPESASEGPDDPLSQLVVRGESTADATATVTFSIDRTLLEERGLEPDDVALYEANDGTWIETETTVSDETAGSYQFTATVASLEALSVGERQSGTESSMPGFEVVTAIAAIALLVSVWAANSRDQ